MALRENERRILAEIEHRLSEDDPELAERLSAFGTDDPFAEDGPEGVEDGAGWKPWAVCGAIAALLVGLLVVVFAMTPPQPVASPSRTTSSPEAVVSGVPAKAVGVPASS
ncbi:DUF3040 domain-containing protein [Marinitenerispora sediminis]|uniref:DUF3040 domain-containing protein n=1 Tax=Marinitenerispora sediminis TaxID=1931232 RepID=A0A368T0X7_9ACTN|nr:DUF3040 domain-containing protein [Marinitenerispora sediminis]RCV50405.1 hypothetical protein DEF23_22060 [Marinitenerispora sediminis]RCV53364.1 hypothetical protein DEF24_20750 [Marinitenerispora sediminis]RCV56519.1 hypothetical protein DEF28_03360 [Marinitenerispora sediminis]